MQETLETVRELLEMRVAQLVVSAAMLAILLVISYYIVRKFRDRIDEEDVSTSELLTSFRDLHEDGDLSEREYREIKSVLSQKMQNELNDSDANE